MTGGIRSQKVAPVVHVLDPHAALHRHRRVGFTVESDEGGSRCGSSVSDAPWEQPPSPLLFAVPAHQMRPACGLGSLFPTGTTREGGVMD